MRVRLIVGSVVLTAAVIVAFFVPAGFALADAEREAQVVELQQEAADAAASTEEGLHRAVPSADDPLRAAKRRGEEEHRYGLYDPAGRRTAGDGPLRLEGWLRAALDGSSRSGRAEGLRIAAVPLASGGALRVSEPVDEADERVQAALVRLALQGLGLLVAASLLAGLVARRLTRPLGALGAAATRLGGGDFTARAPLAGVPEVDEVAVALNATAERLGASVERLRRVTTDASHQLRTPLAGLRASLEAELLAPRPDPSTALRDALGAVERLERTVVALTELARDEVAAEVVPVADVLRSAADRWADQLATAGRHVRVAAADGLAVLARRPAVDAILDVLLDNALHHGAGRITLAAELGVGGVALCVADEGSCTVPDADLFGRRPAGRGGIGLALARALAEAEDGRLRLAADRPTTFELQLPTGDATGAAAATVGAPRGSA